MTEIVGACLSQFHDDANSFELLLAYADGREFGHLVSRRVAQKIAAEFANEFEAATEAALQELRAAVIEECAKVADAAKEKCRIFAEQGSLLSAAKVSQPEQIAADIRALMSDIHREQLDRPRIKPADKETP